MPKEIKLKDLKHHHESMPRNERIAKVFHARGLIETWGTGTNKMIDDGRAEGVPDPEFKERTGGLTVFKELIGRTQPNATVIEPQLSARQKAIFDAIKKHGAMSTLQLMDILVNPTSRRMVRMELDYLRKMDLVEMEGYGRTALWKAK